MNMSHQDSLLAFVIGVLLSVALGCADIDSSAADTSKNNDNATAGVKTERDAPGDDLAPTSKPQEPSEFQDINREPPSPVASGDTQDISWDDIKLNMREDQVFRPFMMTPEAQALDGKRIRITGFMLPHDKMKGIQQFVLLKNTECKYGPGGQADHLINVTMIDDKSTLFRNGIIEVEGVLTINIFNGPDGNTWSIFDLACDKVEKFRPRR